MSQSINPNVHELRESARHLDYPNTEAERANLKRVDDAVFEKVRIHESGIIASATEFIQNNSVEVQAADKFVDVLREDVTYALDRRDADTAAIAERYETLRSQANQAIAALERAEREAAWHIAKVDDPYGSYVSLVSKYPTLKPSIRLQ